MRIKEKVAYLQGLADGVNVESTDNGKMIKAIIDVLVEIADEIDEINENALDIAEELDALSEDLAEVEDILDDDDDEDFDPEEFLDGRWDDDWDEDEYSCLGCENAEAEPETQYTIDVTCPECGADIEITSEDIANEEAVCSACGKLIELQIDEVDEGGEGDEGKPNAADAADLNADAGPVPL